jgi:hypothetical protein
VRVITPRSYHYVAADRALADQIMRRLSLEPNTVTLMEISEAGVLIEQLVLDEHGKPLVRDRDYVRKVWRV